MQLKQRRPAGTAAEAGSIAASLAAATAALLGQTLPGSAVAQELTPWEFDSAALYYGESDGRVRDLSVNVLARKELREEGFLNLNFGYDTLTGASPSGAVPDNTVHTYTSPSGGRTYSIPAGELPLDTSFHDSRKAIAADYEWPVTRLTQLDVGVSTSFEYDYTHTGVNFKIAHDFNNRNTTVSFGAAEASDTISPIGGTPIPLTIVGGNDDGANKLGNQSKDVTDLLLGLTQVINRKTIVQVNYSVSQSNGYLADPYKLLSVVDPVLGDPIPGPGGGSGNYLYIYENRPDSREKQDLYGLLKRDVAGDVFEISYRYMDDDWDITSQTVDIHYRRNVDRDTYVQPHIRFYSQTAASFYRTDLFQGEALPVYASADYRLSELTAVTLGLEIGTNTSQGKVSGRVELYHQSGKPSPGSQVGVLQRFDLNPGFNAVIAQIGYKFGG